MTTTNESTRPVSRLGFGSPRLNDYFGVWAIADEHAAGLIRMAAQINVRLHVLRAEATAEAEASEQACGGSGRPAAEMDTFGSGWGETLLSDGTAVIRLEGTLMKFSSSLSRGTSTVDARRKVRKAKNDDRVQRVMLIVDSPGGTVAGTQDLADDVADLAAVKPTHAYVEDLCASAALWIASQTTQISAGRTSLVGSIGAVMAVADHSKYAAKAGIKVHVITSSGAEKFKGAGIAGSKVSAEQLAEWKAKLDGLADHFLAAVGKGRGIDAKTMRTLADGRVHLAEAARGMKLIDAVESLDAAMDRLRAAKAPTRQTMKVRADDSGPETQTESAGGAGNQPPTAVTAAGESDMEGKNNGAGNVGGSEQPKAATVAELEAACPGATAEFLVDQAKKGATVASAKDAFVGFQAAQIRSRDEQITALQKENGDLKAGAKAAETKPAEAKSGDTKSKTGIEPIKSQGGEATGGGEDGDVLAEFDRRVSAKVTATGKSRAAASQEVLASDDGFRTAYIAATQAARSRR